MTSKQNKLSTPARLAPVELHDEALDRVAGGATPTQSGVFNFRVTATGFVK